MINSEKQPDNYCNVDKYLTLISTKWTAHIIWLLSQNDEMRFGQIQKQLALVSSKVLTQRLKLLQQHTFIWRRQEETVPITVYYGLTSKGKELATIVDFIVKNAEAWNES